MGAARGADPAHPGRLPVLVGVLLGALALAGLQAWRGLDYWNYSEGVYALTARYLIDGADVWGEVVVAQPPGSLLLGSAALELQFSLRWLRTVLGTVQLLAGALAGLAAWRLTRRPLAAAAAVPLVLLTPWAVREHGALTPEVAALPLLLGAALLCARERTATLGGVAAALLVFVKWPLALPALAVVLLAADRRRAGTAAAVALLAQAALATAILGWGFWEQSVLAQLAIDERPALRDVAGYLVQAGWSLAGLVVAAAIGLRAPSRDPALARTLAGAAAGTLVTVLSILKVGTALNVLVPVEAILVPLAVAGATGVARRRRRAVATAGLAVALVMSLALLAQPDGRFPFLYPTSEPGAWGREATGAEVRAAAEPVAGCPASTDVPLVLFVGGGRPPADQPDGFLTRRSSRLEAVARRMDAEPVVCPPQR